MKKFSLLLLMLFVFSIFMFAGPTAFAAGKTSDKQESVGGYKARDFNHKLKAAILSGKIDKVKRLGDDNPDLLKQTKDDLGNTPLHWTFLTGYKRPALLKYFLSKGVDVNSANLYDGRPLHTAAELGDMEGVKILIKHGADVNVETGLDFTPLHYAAFAGRLDMVKYLLSQGAALNTRNFAGETPYAVAVRRKKDKTAAYLKKQGGVDFLKYLKPVSRLNKSELKREAHYAAIWGKRKRLEKIIDRDPSLLKGKDTTGETLLTNALQRGHLDVAHYLIKNDADVTGAIVYATFYNDPVLLKEIISKGADVNYSTESGITPLHMARKPEIAELLIRHGANVNIRSKTGETPLHQAAAKGNLKLLDKLVKSGADVNAQSNTGETPLFNAVVARDPIVVDYLLKEGADPDMKDIFGLTPTRRAIELKAEKVIEVFEKNKKNKK